MFPPLLPPNEDLPEVSTWKIDVVRQLLRHVELWNENELIYWIDPNGNPSERAAHFFKIPGYRNSSSKDVHKIPGMLKPLFHWQWLCVFVSILFNTRTDGRFGALIGDEMGLGKV